MTIKKTSPAFTPGPWGFIAEEWLFNGTPTIAAEGGKGLILATITHGGKGNYPGQLGNPGADARLMAAAPDLLAACESALEDARMALRGEWDKSDEGFQAQVRYLQRVINNAYGRAA